MVDLKRAHLLKPILHIAVTTVVLPGRGGGGGGEEGIGGEGRGGTSSTGGGTGISCDADSAGLSPGLPE